MFCLDQLCPAFWGDNLNGTSKQARGVLKSGRDAIPWHCCSPSSPVLPSLRSPTPDSFAQLFEVIIWRGIVSRLLSLGGMPFLVPTSLEIPSWGGALTCQIGVRLQWNACPRLALQVHPPSYFLISGISVPWNSHQNCPDFYLYLDWKIGNAPRALMRLVFAPWTPTPTPLMQCCPLAYLRIGPLLGGPTRKERKLVPAAYFALSFH